MRTFFNSLIMERGQEFRFFAQHLIRRFLPTCNIASDFTLISGLAPVMNPELIDSLIKALWVKTNVNILVWSQYVKKHSQRMHSSRKLYVIYILYACQVMNDGIIDVYDRFLSIISTIMAITTTFLYYGNKKCIQYTSKLLTVCYENMLKETFCQEGGWIKLDKYISEHDFLKVYDDMSTFSEIGSFAYNRFANDIHSLTSGKTNFGSDTTIIKDDVESNPRCIKLAEEVIAHFVQDSSFLATSSKRSVLKKTAAALTPDTSKPILHSHKVKETRLKSQLPFLNGGTVKTLDKSSRTKAPNRRKRSSFENATMVGLQDLSPGTNAHIRGKENGSSRVQRTTKNLPSEEIKNEPRDTTNKIAKSNLFLNSYETKSDSIPCTSPSSISKDESSKGTSKVVLSYTSTPMEVVKKEEPCTSESNTTVEKKLLNCDKSEISNIKDKSFISSRAPNELSNGTADSKDFTQLSQIMPKDKSLNTPKPTNSSISSTVVDQGPSDSFKFLKREKSIATVWHSISKNQCCEPKSENSILLQAKAVLRDIISEADVLGDMLHFFAE